MPRCARRKTETGAYHVMMRGINKQVIFNDNLDKLKFCDILKKYKDECGFELFSYCMMDNHVHIALRESEEPIETIFKKINTSYAYYFNQKYKRCGHLFQDRYRSEPIYDDAQLLQTVRYIHRNPLKAGMCKSLDSYLFSSYMEYLDNTVFGLCDTELPLTIAGGRNAFIEVNEDDQEYECLDDDMVFRHGVSDSEAVCVLNALFPGIRAEQIAYMEKEQRDLCVKALRKAGISVRQICRITGLGRGAVGNVRPW